MKTPGTSFENVAEVLVRMPEPFAGVVSQKDPISPAEARFSLPYCIATVICRGTVGLDSFTDTAINDHRVSELAARVVLIPYPVPREMSDLSPDMPDTVVLRLRDGSEVSTEVSEVNGSHGRPMSDNTLKSKFRSCACTCMPAATADRILGTLWRLDQPLSIGAF